MSKKEPKIIKRYANRKLYDTLDSCYVTLEEIGDMIKMGEEIRVIDNASREDLTAMTLAQIIFEEQKRKTNVMPLDIFTGLIRTGQEALSPIREFVDEKLKPTLENVQHLPSLQTEIRQLRNRIEILEKKLRSQNRHA
ncbi:MAG: polyhydroxyalkanoate synthesis regulator DNA-binding domain-containing protein [Deltaproteobacteria bacterium]|nr:polyhydroxyalkanoate synthesis regulator DNA-binding domain-containing protein [Deltaproteobacteria bacterium]